MRGSNRKTKKEKNKIEDEVEQLLQAAQDQVLLNLSVNSHIARAPPTPIPTPIPTPSIKDQNKDKDDNVDIHLDLERRFQALKTKYPATATHLPHSDQELKSVLGDDLSARFAALKAKSWSSSSSSVTIGLGASGSAAVNEEEDEDEEEQVLKLIEWAKDTARLDPSPPSDDDHDCNSSYKDNDNTP